MSDERFSSQARVKRRDRLSLLAAALLHASKGIYKTELMCRVGLTSAQIDKYIDVLVESKLLEVSENSNHVYRTTTKGERFVHAFCNLVTLLD